MARLLGASLSAAVALLVPGLLAVNGVRVIASEWYVRFLYDHGGVPRDRYGMTDDDRLVLAVAGLRAVLPSREEGPDSLRRARLPTGAPAFNGRELRHLADVRALLADAFGLQLAAGAAVAAAALLALPFPCLRRAVARGLRRGAWLTVAVAALAGGLSLTSWSSFSTFFHGLFFAGESWRFADTDTLRRLYPDRFWIDTAVVLGLLAVLQAAALLVLLRLGRRLSGRGLVRTVGQA